MNFSYFKNRNEDVQSRTARHADLERFVRINEDYPYISGNSEQRYKLYENWFEVCPTAFRLMEYVRYSSAKTKLVGVSIILPLTVKGQSIIVRNNASALMLQDEDVEQRVNHNYNCLLFDTLVVNAFFKQRRFAYTQKLLADHVAALLGNQTHHLVDFYTEPDLESVRRLLLRTHFKVVKKQGSELFHRQVLAGFKCGDYESMIQQLESNQF